MKSGAERREPGRPARPSAEAAGRAGGAGRAAGGGPARRHPHLARRAPRRRRPRASTSRTSRAAAPAAGSRRTTCSAPPPATARRAPAAPPGERHAHQGRARRCSPATWTSRGRSRPPPRSARSPSRSLDARRKELKNAGQKVSFTHLIAYAIARAATEQMPVMAHHFAEIDGKPHRVDDGAVNLGIAVDVERKDGGRTLMVPVIRDAGRLSFSELPRRLQRPDRPRAREQADRRRPRRAPTSRSRTRAASARSPPSRG